MTAFPWEDAMRLGLGVLRLAPAQFWAMTPRELAAAHAGAMGRPTGGPAMERDRLLDLIGRFPDAGTRTRPGAGSCARGEEVGKNG